MTEQQLSPGLIAHLDGSLAIDWARPQVFDAQLGLVRLGFARWDPCAARPERTTLTPEGHEALAGLLAAEADALVREAPTSKALFEDHVWLAEPELQESEIPGVGR